MDFSVNLYPFKGDARTDYQGVCGIVANIGYKAIEPVHGLIPDSASVLRDIPAALGMGIISGFIPIEEITSDGSDALFSFYRDAEVRFLIAGDIPNPDELGSTQAAITAAVQAAEIAAKNGFTLLLHNHGRALKREPDGRLLLEHFRDSDKIGLELDVGFVHAAGLDLKETLDLFEPNIELVHLKDVTETTGSVDLGDGDVDFRLVLSWCAEHEIPYPMVEHHLAEPPADSLKRSFEYVDSIAREIGV